MDSLVHFLDFVLEYPLCFGFSIRDLFEIWSLGFGVYLFFQGESLELQD